MGVTLLSTPDDYGLSRGGRTRYQFATDGAVQALGASAITNLLLTGPVPEHTVLHLRWNGQVRRFVFKLQPSAADELPAGSGDAVHANALAARLGQLQPIRQDFRIEQSYQTPGPRIILTARQPGPAYNVTVQVNYPSPPAGTPLVGESARTGIDASIRERYGVWVELRVLRANQPWPLSPLAFDEDDFETLYTTHIEADGDGTASFDVGGLLHSQFSPDGPALTGSATDEATTRIYYINYAEAYGLPHVIGALQSDRLRWVYYGGLDYPQKAGGSLPLARLVTPQAGEKFSDKALRLGDTVRYVRPDEPQFLTFLNLRAPTDAVLHYRFSFPTRTDLVYTPPPPPSVGGNFQTGQKLLFAVGRSQLPAPLEAMLAQAGELPKEFTVQLTAPLLSGPGTYSAGPMLSRAYRFILDYRYSPYVRYFLYLDSLGGWDTLATFGKGTDEWNRFSELSERTLSPAYTIGEGEFVEYDSTLRVSTEVTTGFLQAPDLLRWADFYRSSHRFRLAKDGSAGFLPLPISVTTKSIKQAKDGDTLTAHRFEFIHNYRQAWVSDLDEANPEPPLPPVGFSPVAPVIIPPTVTIVPVTDPSVPQAARELTTDDLQSLRAMKLWGNHATKGYLKQETADRFFLRAAPPEGTDGWVEPKGDIGFARIAGLPPTARAHNIQDVYDRAELDAKLAQLEPPPLPPPDWWPMPVGIYPLNPHAPRLFKVASFPPSTEGTYDHHFFELVGGGWESYRKVYVRLQCSNRGVFRYLYEIEGPADYVGLRFYREESGAVTVYGYQAFDYGEGAIRVHSTQGTTFPDLPPVYGEHPPGILLLDTTRPDRYAPVRHVEDGVSRTRFAQIIQNMTTMEQGRILNPPKPTADMLPFLNLTVRHQGTGDVMDAPDKVLIELLENLGFIRSEDPALPKVPLLQAPKEDEYCIVGQYLGANPASGRYNNGAIYIPDNLFQSADGAAPQSYPYTYIVYEVKGLPPGLRWHRDIPVGEYFENYSITGPVDQVGTFVITIRAIDTRTSLWSETTFSLYCTSPNRAPQPPVLETYQLVNGTERTLTLPAFTDPDDNLLEYRLTIEGLPTNQTYFRFDAASRKLTMAAGTPVGTYKFNYAATDTEGLSAGVQVTIVVSTVSTAFRLVSPEYLCETGELHFRFEGGDGTPVTFWGPGITGETLKAGPHYIDAGVRQDQSEVTLFARQSSVQQSLVFKFREVCQNGNPNPTPDEKPVSPGYTPITIRVGEYFDYTFAPFTHSKNSISYAFSGGIPPGLLLNNPATRQLSGTPATAGEYAIQITATAALGGGRQSQASDTLRIKVLERASTIRQIEPAFTAPATLILRYENALAGQAIEYRIREIDDTWSLLASFTIPPARTGQPLTCEIKQLDTISSGIWTPGQSSTPAYLSSSRVQSWVGTLNNGVRSNDGDWQCYLARAVFQNLPAGTVVEFGISYLGSNASGEVFPFAATPLGTDGTASTHQEGHQVGPFNASAPANEGYRVHVRAVGSTDWKALADRSWSASADNGDVTGSYGAPATTPVPATFVLIQTDDASPDDQTLGTFE